MTASFVVLLASPALGGGDAALIAARRLIQDGFNRGDSPAILKSRGQLLGMLAADPGSAEIHYGVALADWRAVPLLAGKNRDAAKRHCEEGLEHCDAALKADPRMAEAMALKAGLQGMSIQFNGAAAIVLAPQMQANMARALELAPDNPRIHLLDGINTFHTPAFFGGGAERAMTKMRKAIDLFARGAGPDTTGTAWGHDDAYAWVGRAAAKLEDPAAARGHYLRALEINPDNGWVKHTLLPESERALAKKGDRDS